MGESTARRQPSFAKGSKVVWHTDGKLRLKNVGVVVSDSFIFKHGSERTCVRFDDGCVYSINSVCLSLTNCENVANRARRANAS